MISYPGVQWLMSESIADDLRKSGVRVRKLVADGNKNTLLENCVYIKDLPVEMRATAAKFDIDQSGTIGFLDLEKIDQKRSLSSMHKGKLVISPIKVVDPTKSVDRKNFNMSESIRIVDLPAHLQNAAKAWDVTGSGSITLTNLAKMDPKSVDQFLSSPVTNESGQHCPDQSYLAETESQYYDATTLEGGFPPANLSKSFSCASTHTSTIIG